MDAWNATTGTPAIWCYLEAKYDDDNNTYQCPSGGSWQLLPGRVWRHGSYDTQAKCEAGICSNSYHPSSSVEECTRKKGCSSQCSYCASTFEVDTVDRSKSSACVDIDL